EGDEEIALVVGWEGGALIEVEAKRRGVGLHLDGRPGDAVAGAGLAELRIEVAPVHAARPAEIVAVVDEVDRLAWLVIAKHVAAVVGRPEVAGAGLEDEADGVAQATRIDARVAAVRAQLEDRGAAVVLLDADVAARSNRDVEHA